MDMTNSTNAETKYGATLKLISEMQPLVDSLKANPAYAKYVEQRKLHLIDSRLQDVDDLLTRGLLK